ncbi:hypothetical protein KFE25_006599 [Diacronema lutheri]|uniref:EamA domain-containing protein n=1 Tax=Diacronema lutheri TaxID=2081491 RepID=A0A8J5X6J7_DIALT|nr:hypothetical protein KFE25_006599 [Diacronema lutheri]
MAGLVLACSALLVVSGADVSTPRRRHALASRAPPRQCSGGALGSAAAAARETAALATRARDALPRAARASRAPLCLRGGGALDGVAAAARAIVVLATRSLDALPVAARGWTILGLATTFELASTLLLRLGEGFVRPVPSALGSALYAASFLAFNYSLRYLEISKAYAIWSALVIALLAVLACVFFGEELGPLKLAGIVATICGTAMISLSGSEGTGVDAARAVPAVPPVAIPLVLSAAHGRG